MSYKIVVDSCCDLTEQYKQDKHFQIIPLTLQVDDTFIVDDETFDQANFLRLVKGSPNCPKSACPSPEDYKNAYDCEAEDVYVVTLSQHLSGSYNSAMVGRNLYLEDHGDKNIAVFCSQSASIGESLIAFKIKELCENGVPFHEVVEQVTAFRDGMETYFVLETLDMLRKNGRLTGLQAFIATALSIKPIMYSDGGIIGKLEQARGTNKALIRMCDIAMKRAGKTEDKILAIGHCNCPDRALFVKQEMLKRADFKDVYIADTAGVASLYAADGGIIMCM